MLLPHSLQREAILCITAVYSNADLSPEFPSECLSIYDTSISLSPSDDSPLEQHEQSPSSYCYYETTQSHFPIHSIHIHNVIESLVVGICKITSYLIEDIPNTIKCMLMHSLTLFYSCNGHNCCNMSMLHYHYCWPTKFCLQALPILRASSHPVNYKRLVLCNAKRRK